MNQSDPQTVGERLRAAREALNISLPDAARATSIKYHHLQELENDHPEVFISAAQARGFLRLYASFLNLDFDDLIALWESPAKKVQPDSTSEKIEPVQSDASFESRIDVNPEIEIVDGTAGQPDDLLESMKDIDNERKPQGATPKEKSSINLPVNKKIKTFFSRISVPENLKSLTEKIGLPKTKMTQESVVQETSQEIFEEIGTSLHEKRLAMDLSLSDIEHFTSLKRMVLVAIEDGRFNDLPSTVQGRGMLNNYAKFLAIEDSGIMDRYAQALLLQREERMPTRKPAEPSITFKVSLPEGVRRVLNPDLVIGGALILGLFGFILWGASQMLSVSGEQPTDAPSISEMLQLTPTISPSPGLAQIAESTITPEEATALPGVVIAQSTPTPIATANAAPLQLYIIAHDRAFMRVAVDGVSAFDGRVVPGNVYTYSGDEIITLLTGNGAALEIYFNQEFLGKLGSVGEVVDLRFSLQGLQTPTPQPQATPTAMQPTQAEPMVEESN